MMSRHAYYWGNGGQKVWARTTISTILKSARYQIFTSFKYKIEYDSYWEMQVPHLLLQLKPAL